jgi:ABC-2 type transport system permease protein
MLNIARNDLAMVMTEPAVYSVLLLMPLLLMAFLRPLFGLALQAQGYGDLTGSELAVPGLAVMFSFFLVSLVGYSILDERGWNTWPRLKATRVPPLALIAAKGIVPVGIALLQQVTLFVLGVLFFGLLLRGSALAMVALAVALDCCIVSLGVALAAFATTVRQVNVLGNLSTLAFGAFGGALTPVALLPDWAQRVAPAMPSYWAVSGFHRVLLDGVGLAGVTTNILVLLTFAVTFAGVAGYGVTRRENSGAA